MSTDKGKVILIVEDEAHIAEGLKLNLELQGYTAHIAADGSTGLQQWQALRPDLIVLDIMLPGIDGLSVLQRIRLEDERLPILVLSAKAATEDKVRGLSLGVDDYLSKPFNLDEFLLRVERLLTRSQWGQENGKADALIAGAGPDTYRFGENQIDFIQATARCQQGQIHLTEQEVRLLKLFIAYRGKPLPREKLLEIGWGYTRKTSTRTVDNFIVRLRRYFEPNPKKPIYFKSLRSVGYLFDHE
jgi:DNA-binding response OmpR family regulator